jgi:uncharacterized protein (DUF4415 family)
MSGKERGLGSDLEKAKALPITPEQYEEIPELTDEWFEGAELHVGGVKVPRGRPPSPTRKVALKLRIDPDVIEAFRATGPKWQSRMNAVLRQAAGLSRQARPGSKRKVRRSMRRTGRARQRGRGRDAGPN